MWRYYMPTKVFFGLDSVKQNWEIFSSLGKNALIVTGKRSSKENGSLDDLKATLQKANVNFVVFDDVEENPSFRTVRKIVEIYVDGNYDFVIGLGGGSPLDTAKAVAVLLKNKKLKVEDLYDPSKYTDALPICAIPTTAGTGSEVTQYSVLTDDNGFKRGFSSDVAFPKVAFIDPKYTLMMNEGLTRSTGLDALCHAVEGYLSRRATPISDVIALQAIELIAQYLPKVLQNPNDFEAREKMCLASCLAGVVIAQTSTTLAHALGYPLSTFKDIRHGDATAAFLDVVVDQARNEVPEKVEKIESILGKMDEFLKNVGLNVSVEISDEELEIWVQKAISAKHVQWTRGNFDAKLVRELYERVRKY
ncbi:iron-containing alcohol dehydrogenase family protein [Pseudothermotoga thermarum]|uniref:Iron-containing alcohol dehydrogenase n=1 Tax=Pseudothermotoga thermarum DSM 5069 TaxID=688269 RepID=F7YYD3_9THEM|nr:iron-containing alcohol dehydrogenase family protein [Pseudothermotoga thermarum]AEH50956.1 iron-containing alcohol dehydrogenase [Pseudothermotoga thermarum DSM 5069]